MEVFRKHKAQFQGLVIMMEGFHLLMTLLATNRSRSGEAGLKDIAVQNEVIAEG